MKETAECSICGKSICGLEDMKLDDKFYCTKCRMDVVREKSKIYILVSRKKELVIELNDINLKIDEFKGELQ